MNRIAIWGIVLCFAGFWGTGCSGHVGSGQEVVDASEPGGEDGGEGFFDAGPDGDESAGEDGTIVGEGGDEGGSIGDDGGGQDQGQSGGRLAERYPNDHGLGSDPAVVWFEDFEEGSLGAIAARYDQVRDNGRWTLVTDTPSGTGHALALRAGDGQDAVDLYKKLPDHEEWYVRWYAKYEPGVNWHHSGMWLGGYNPPLSWPNPQAGRRPAGDDRFSVAIEPVFRSPSLRLDFYNYWMKMHSWMADPVDDGTAYYGNSLVHRNDFTVDEGEWMCLEVHVRLNPSPDDGAGAVLEVWKNDELVASFTDDGPSGYWIRDKFCPEWADGRECTDYPAPFDQLLDLQFRSTLSYGLNYFWPQNYITEGAGTLILDQMVVATSRVGCMR